MKFKINSQTRQILRNRAEILANGGKVAGWKRYKSTYRKMDAFYHEGLGVVLKCPKFIMEPRTPLVLRVPTISLGDGWVVQPIALKTNLKAAVEEIRTKLKKFKGINPDIHTGNVGWVDNQPLMFDW